MAGAADKAKQRIPFGKNGIMDGNGNIIRSDHPNMSDVMRSVLPAARYRREAIDSTVADAVEGVKRKQDKAAGIKRRSN